MLWAEFPIVNALENCTCYPARQNVCHDAQDADHIAARVCRPLAGCRVWERQGAQSFFNDLCGLVGHATPAAYGDPAAFTFEKSVPGGFADAYYEEHFGWEFKGRDAQLDGAFDQLLRYQVHLKTPPLLIVSSFRTLRIQTNFPGMETARYDVDIGDQASRALSLADFGV